MYNNKILLDIRCWFQLNNSSIFLLIYIHLNLTTLSTQLIGLKHFQSTLTSNQRNYVLQLTQVVKSRDVLCDGPSVKLYALILILLFDTLRFGLVWFGLVTLSPAGGLSNGPSCWVCRMRSLRSIQLDLVSLDSSWLLMREVVLIACDRKMMQKTMKKENSVCFVWWLLV